MWLAPVVTTEPASEPVTVAEAKAFLRVTNTAEDDLISSLVTSARDYLEQYTGLRFVTQTLSIATNDWRDLEHLPTAPVQTIEEITYLDTEGAEQTWATDQYRLIANGLDNAIRPALNVQRPTIASEPDAVRLSLVCGYETLPGSIRNALLMLVGQWYDNRSASTDKQPYELPHAVTSLLTNYRLF